MKTTNMIELYIQNPREDKDITEYDLNNRKFNYILNYNYFKDYIKKMLNTNILNSEDEYIKIWKDVLLMQNQVYIDISKYRVFFEDQNQSKYQAPIFLDTDKPLRISLKYEIDENEESLIIIFTQ